MRMILCLLALPLLAGAAARADDPPPSGSPGKAPVEAGGPAKPEGEAKPPADAKPATSAIAWIHDLADARTKAAAEKKGLFVYLTPSWFT